MELPGKVLAEPGAEVEQTWDAEAMLGWQWVGGIW